VGRTPLTVRAGRSQGKGQACESSHVAAQEDRPGSRLTILPSLLQRADPVVE
jgi:hypothetical protein